MTIQCQISDLQACVLRRYMALGKKTNQLMSFFGKQTVKRLVPLWLDSFKAAARSRFEKRRLEVGRPTYAQG